MAPLILLPLLLPAVAPESLILLMAPLILLPVAAPKLLRLMSKPLALAISSKGSGDGGGPVLLLAPRLVRLK